MSHPSHGRCTRAACCSSEIVHVKGGKSKETYEITKSGHYVLKGDLSFCPEAGGFPGCCTPFNFVQPDTPNCPLPCPLGPVCNGDDAAVVAIKISASNVTLDLGGFELSQGNALPNVRGIQVERGSENVQILNGTVRGFSQWGARVRGDTSAVSLTDLTVTQCGFNNPETLRQFEAAAGGLALGESRYFDLGGAQDAVLRVLSNGYLDRVRVVDNYFMGMILGRSENLQADSCNFDGTYRNIEPAPSNATTDRIALYCYPLCLIGGGYDPDVMVAHASFRNCTFNNARNDTKSAVGEETRDVTGTRCEASNTLDTLFENCEFRDYYTLSGRSTAVDHDQSIGMSYENCLFSDMISERSFAEGLHFSGSIDRGEPCSPTQAIGINSQIVITGCTFRRIRTIKLGTDSSRGIWAWGQQILVENCSFDDIYNEKRNSFGLQITSVPRTVTSVDDFRMRNCTLANVKSGDLSVGVSYQTSFGMVPNSRNALIENVWMSNINGAVGALGLLVEGGNNGAVRTLSNVVVRNSEIVDVIGTGFAVAAKVAGLVNGVFDNLVLSNSGVGFEFVNVKNVVLRNSLISSIFFDGVVFNGADLSQVLNTNISNCGGAGIKDLAALSTSAFLGNTVFECGSGILATYPNGGVVQALTRSGPGAAGNATGSYQPGVDNVIISSP